MKTIMIDIPTIPQYDIQEQSNGDTNTINNLYTNIVVNKLRNIGYDMSDKISQLNILTNNYYNDIIKNCIKSVNCQQNYNQYFNEKYKTLNSYENIIQYINDQTIIQFKNESSIIINNHYNLIANYNEQLIIYDEIANKYKIKLKIINENKDIEYEKINTLFIKKCEREIEYFREYAKYLADTYMKNIGKKTIEEYRTKIELNRKENRRLVLNSRRYVKKGNIDYENDITIKKYKEQMNDIRNEFNKLNTKCELLIIYNKVSKSKNLKFIINENNRTEQYEIIRKIYYEYVNYSNIFTRFIKDVNDDKVKEFKNKSFNYFQIIEDHKQSINNYINEHYENEYDIIDNEIRKNDIFEDNDIEYIKDIEDYEIDENNIFEISVNKPKKIHHKKCEHNKHYSKCKECNKSLVCIHNKLKKGCFKCGGSEICEHGKRKTRCKTCGGSELCIHNKPKSGCKLCNIKLLCEHNKYKSVCKICNSGLFCIHGKRKSQCGLCFGKEACEHNSIISNCRICGPQKYPDNWCQLCKYVNIRGGKYKPYCFTCYCVQNPDAEIPIKYKLKEHHMTDSLKEHYPNIKMIFDQKVDDGCSLRRPDVRIECFTHTIIIECDENKHVGYSCENKRTMEIFQDLGNRPIVFLRFNPDSYKNDKGELIQSCFKQTTKINNSPQKIEWDKRIKYLKERIDYHLTTIPTKEVTIEELFYNQ